MTFQPDYTPEDFEGAPEELNEDTLSERLRVTPEDEQQIQHLRVVDSLLTAAPEVAPRPGFALRVMDLLRQRNREIRQHGGTGMILGLSMAVVFVVTLLSLATLFVLGLLQSLVGGTQPAEIIGGALGLLANIVAGVNTALGDVPFAALMTSAFVPMFLLWVWLMRRLLSDDKAA